MRIKTEGSEVVVMSKMKVGQVGRNAAGQYYLMCSNRMLACLTQPENSIQMDEEDFQDEKLEMVSPGQEITFIVQGVSK